MRGALLGCCLLGVTINCAAHRLDEYLQATRIAILTNRIDLSCELTPGVDVAGQVIAAIDSDRDGNISGDEGTAYVRRFLKDLVVGLDGKRLSLSLQSISLPAVPEIRSGVGVIQIRATSVIDPLASGAHSLTLTNGHLPAISVYLVNALRSTNAAVEMGKQARDELQREYGLQFRVRPFSRKKAQ